jgi:transposase
MLDSSGKLLCMQEALFSGTDAAPQANIPSQRAGAVRMRLADRSQVGMQFCCIDELVPADHQVRVTWDAVCQMDLTKFEASIQAREFSQGRSANDVRVMVGLWLWAAVQNVARGRLLERLCETDLTFKWMCGGLSMNYHTLNDFRVGHQEALDRLFTATLGRLIRGELVTVTRISQDGLRVRASAGGKSFRKRPTLEACLAEAEAHLADLKKVQDSPDNEEGQEQENRRKTEAAADRLNRVRQALAELPKVEESRAKCHDKKKREKPASASTTDAEARMMKMPNGGFNAAYNVQLAVDPQSRAIVGVAVSNCGGDAPLSEPMREQVEKRTGQKVSEHLMDGGYVKSDMITDAAAAKVTVYAPVPDRLKVGDRFARRPSDTEAVAEWRSRMNSDAGKQTYHQRASTSETVNADVRTYRGLAPFAVRGIAKTTSVALWSALAYNLMHFAWALT